MEEAIFWRDSKQNSNYSALYSYISIAIMFTF